MKKIMTMATWLLAAILSFSCSHGFETEKVEALLEKTQLTSDDYNVLLEYYDEGMDDVIGFSAKDPGKMTEKERQEVLTLYEIGKRLAMDEQHLDASQLAEFERITQKGKEEQGK